MRWLLVLVLLAACGGSKEPCTASTCIIKGITLDLPLTLHPGDYLSVSVSSPGSPSTSICNIYMNNETPQAYCSGMTATIEGGAVKGFVLPASFTAGGILTVTRDGAPLESDSFEVRQSTSGDCSCPDPYAVVHPGQGS